MTQGRPRLFLCTLVAMALAGCAGDRPAGIGVTEGGLAPCPDSPNCVASDATDDRHAAPAFRLKIAPDAAWRSLSAVIAAWPRTQVVTRTDDYLHAESRSRLFGFVDDLEFHLRPAAGIIAFRSASRLGYSDLGVNRRRVEAIRERLQADSAVE